MGLAVGVQTNGVFPDTLDALIKEHLVDRVALDIKARWARYNNLLKGNYVKDVQKSLALCREAHESGQLAEFEVVITLFRGYDDEVSIIAGEVGKTDLVLQQGVTEKVSPFSEDEMKKIADTLARSVRIRYHGKEVKLSMKVIGVVGLPASGKGEFSKIASGMGIPVIVMGDMIRKAVSEAGLLTE